MASQRRSCHVWVLLLGLPLCSGGCTRDGVSAIGRQASPAGKGAGFYQEVTQQAGITFRYDNDATPERRFIETTGGGCAFLDIDNDGLLDIFAVQGGPAPGSAPRARPPHALYRNRDGTRFEDVTAAVGLAVDIGYAQGVAAADYDNDSWTDLLITTYGGARLFRNQRGKFVDVTRRAGLVLPGEPHWATSAAWADYDCDGLLDLFVCHYASWFSDNERGCFDNQGRPMYCVPTQYVSDKSVLYRNRGDGTFANVSAMAGLDRLEGKALGAAWLDYDADGWPDLCVAHDMASNWLLHNQKNGRFRNRASDAGIATGPVGQPLSGMGITVGDFNGDRREDIVIVNFSLQPRTYLLNTGVGVFQWAGPWAGLGDDTQPFLAFGVDALDYDLDGHLDLLMGNGHINDTVDQMDGGVTYRQRQQLYRNQGDGRFRDEQAAAGDLSNPRLTRGLAVGDFDNDGRPDCLLSGPGEPLALFRNVGKGNHWVGFRLEGVHCNRDAIGTQARVRAGGRTQVRTVRSGSSYCSHSDTRLLFGLGAMKQIEKVEVTWPDGTQQVFTSLPSDRYYWIRESGDCRPDPRLISPRKHDGMAL